ncbi:MAG TPA: GIY-YIG nuclease family protein [Rhodoglobus sp.]|jgi:hypothetical protein|nr:GIY-YIG nuclease family protein [Rhodoglobus sp.]
MARVSAPQDVEAIRVELVRVLGETDSEGRVTGNSKWGAYCFYDYDGEPIYVGQTSEQLRVRIRRHLTNQRTDAVAMNVLDPFEVCWIEMWPLWEFDEVSSKSDEYSYKRAVTTLNSLEYSVYHHVLEMSSLGAVLNEADVAGSVRIDLPPSHRGRIIPDGIYEERRHSDTRIARRASTIAALAKVISEREVSAGLRRTLLTQARRLEMLASSRFDEVRGTVAIPVESPTEETGA